MSKIKRKEHPSLAFISLVCSAIGIFVGLICWFTLPLIERWYDQQDLKEGLTYDINESLNLIEGKYYNEAIEKLEIADEKANTIRSQNDKTEYLCVIRIHKCICHLRIGMGTEDKNKIIQSISMFKQILTLPNIEHFPEYINTINGYISFAESELEKLD